MSQKYNYLFYYGWLLTQVILFSTFVMLIIKVKRNIMQDICRELPEYN
ncbi:hypothetical protein LTSEUGA_3406 [Salmonella enterica subsp. enterica serovar Uganda str. R8-3404]|uniref:Uncharacterized protein n=1 Tax=Salmonella enterica subsp. enterica serovar Uganda str. R8-3404 TaxID=913083 RepID=A0A6C8GZL9_SALET|nr:hypothetical protein LTSEUGA_3406 [Salmonella enterica subsp. enterica serovar Uganda str. R8-3404]